jgi:hypothetical protein
LLVVRSRSGTLAERSSSRAMVKELRVRGQLVRSENMGEVVFSCWILVFS